VQEGRTGGNHGPVSVSHGLPSLPLPAAHLDLPNVRLGLLRTVVDRPPVG
jgi:hypothetical protein